MLVHRGFVTAKMFEKPKADIAFDWEGGTSLNRHQEHQNFKWLFEHLGGNEVAMYEQIMSFP